MSPFVICKYIQCAGQKAGHPHMLILTASQIGSYYSVVGQSKSCNAICTMTATSKVPTEAILMYRSLFCATKSHVDTMVPYTIIFQVASSDLLNMGIGVVSYTLKDIRDEEVGTGSFTIWRQYLVFFLLMLIRYHKIIVVDNFTAGFKTCCLYQTYRIKTPSMKHGR